MLAHLLFLRANGGTEYATALSDTFGTESFIAAALLTQVPEEFIQDVQELYPNDRQIQSGKVAMSCCITGQRSPYSLAKLECWGVVGVWGRAGQGREQVCMNGVMLGVIISLVWQSLRKHDAGCWQSLRKHDAGC